MAKTSKGIYYPYDYSKIADVPEDMKQMAESINKLLEDKEVDETTQNTKITTLQNKVNDLQKENTELSNNMPWNTVAGKSLYITDSAKYSKNSLSLSGDMEQEKRSGKNLIPLSSNRTLNGVTLSVDEKGIYTLNGTATNVCFFTIPLKNVLPIGTSKTMSLQVLDGTASGNGTFYLAFRVRNSDNVYSNVPNMAEIQYLTSGKAYVTKTITNECASAEIAVLSGVTLNNVKLTIQLEEGTTATEFEQYGAMPSTEFPSMPVVCTGVQKIRQFGKNFIKNVVTNTTINGITFTINLDGTIKVNGTATANTVLQFNSKQIILEQGNYKMSGCPTGGTRNTYKLDCIASSGEYWEDTGNACDINITKQTIITKVRIAVLSGVTVNNLLFKPVLEKGSVATTYEPYWEKVHTLNLGTTQLCAIKDTNGNVVAKDRAVYRNNKWQWEKNVGKKVLNGTENWLMVSTNTSTNKRFNINNVFADAQPAKSITVLQECACDKLKTITANETFYNVEGFAFSTLDSATNCVHAFIYTEQTKNMSVAEFKSWLSNNNITVYYILRTPIYTDCTAEQSTVLDKLYNNFALQKGTNNIIVETDNGVGVNMDLTYMQDLQAKLNLLEAMCVSNASQEV